MIEVDHRELRFMSSADLEPFPREKRPKHTNEGIKKVHQRATQGQRRRVYLREFGPIVTKIIHYWQTDLSEIRVDPVPPQYKGSSKTPPIGEVLTGPVRHALINLGSSLRRREIGRTNS